MIQSRPHPDPDGPCGRMLATASHELAGLPDSLETLLESLSEQDVEEVRPQLQEIMHTLLKATRTITDAAGQLNPSGEDGLQREIHQAERDLAGRLLDFRQALGSGSTDTIRTSMRRDLLETTHRWTHLLDAVFERIEPQSGEDS